MALGDSAGILFKIKGDSSDAVRALKETESAAGGLTSNLSSLAAPAALGATALLAIGAAGLTAAHSLFELTKNASEYGSALFDASKRTGLSAAAISTLKVNADSAGSSLERISGSVAKFNTLLGQAESGNKKAAATLAQYNITAKDADGAFAQAVKAVGSLNTQQEKAAASAALFKDRTGELLPVIDQMGGDFDKAEAAAKKLGVTLTDADLKAADDFGDTLTALNTQTKVMAASFALQFAPEITRSIADISKWLASNKDAIREWGDTFANVIRGLKVALTPFFSDTARGFYTLGASIVKAIDPPIIGLTHLLDLLGRVGAAARKGDLLTGEAGGSIAGLAGISAGGGGGGGRAARAPRAQTIKRADTQEDVDKAHLDFVRTTNQQEIALEDAKNKRLIEMEEYRAKQGEISDKELLDFKQKNELDFLVFKQIKLGQELQAARGNAEETKKIENELAVLREKIRQQAIKSETDLYTLNEKIAQAEIDANYEIIKQEETKAAQRQKELDDRHQMLIDTAIKPSRTPQDGGIGGAVASVGSFGQEVDDLLKGGSLDVLVGIGQQIDSVFSQVAEAVGQAVKSFVLFGTAGGSFRKFAAEIIASVAQMATVQAVFELAQGLAMLALSYFTGNPKYAASAGGHFAAAAAYGLIAGVATVAGRAVAGNSFSKQSSAATGGGSDGPDRAARNVDADGKSYSSLEEKTLGGGANVPSIGIRLRLEMSSDRVVTIVKDSIHSNGPLRDLLVTND